MAEKKIESIVDALKEIIDQNSPKHLTDEPYRVYAELIESGSADRKTAAALLHFLVSGMLDTADLSCEVEQLSGAIRRECSLNKKMADMSILVNPEIIPILSGFHSSIIRTRKRPAVLLGDTRLRYYH